MTDRIELLAAGGEKMSKSKGNAISPRDILSMFGGNPDPLRYFLTREMDYGQDGSTHGLHISPG